MGFVIVLLSGLFGWSRQKLLARDFATLLGFAVALTGIGVFMLHVRDNPLISSEDIANSMTMPVLALNLTIKFLTLAIPFLVGFAGRKVRDRIKAPTK
ncbi:hypothetical protein [Sphingobium indicum]